MLALEKFCLMLSRSSGRAPGDVEDLAAQLQKHNFGDTVRLTIQRGKSEQEVSGVLKEAPKTE